MSAGVPESLNPFSNLDEWENFVEDRYRERKSESESRQYENEKDKAMLEWVRKSIPSTCIQKDTPNRT